MKDRYDPSVDAAYVAFNSEDQNAQHGFTYCCDPQSVGGQLQLDFDADGKLVGIEVLNASKKLPEHLLAMTGGHQKIT